MNDFKEVFIVFVIDVLDSYCNMLDLCMFLQCKFWIEELLD